MAARCFARKAMIGFSFSSFCFVAQGCGCVWGGSSGGGGKNLCLRACCC